MSADYSKATWLPSPNFWPGGDGNDLIVVHATASGGPQTGYQLATGQEFTDPNAQNAASVHYINDVDGTVYQIVKEVDSAWGNCCATGASPFDHNYNWNKKSISIENVKHSSDNSEPLTPAQYQSLLALIRDICQRQSIPMQFGSPTQKGIIFHHDLDPINRARCPGTFPYDTFIADLKGGNQPVLNPEPINIPLTSKGEVASFVDVSQFEPNESEFECGFFAAGEVRCAAPVGQSPKCTPEQLDQWADQANVGGNVGVSTGGVSIEDMHNLFKLAGLHYWDIDSIAPGSAQSHDIAEIKAALSHGYPVVVTVVESSIFDMDLGGNPYAPNWAPSGNHVLTVTGIAPDGNLLYHDTANVQGGIFGKIAPQPRRYRNSTTAHTWASIVQLPWLPTIPSGDPLSWAVGGQAPVTQAPNPEQRNNFLAEWQAVIPAISATSGLANFAWAEYQAGKPHGAALSQEFDLTSGGVPARGQIVNNGILIWKNGVASFHPYV